MPRLVRIGLLLVLLGAACGDDDGAATTTIVTTTTVEDDTVVIVIDGTSGSLRLSEDGESRDLGDRIDVDLGDTVRIVITLAETDEVHVHTYDLEVEGPAGEEVELEFVADIAGIFEVELHEAGTVLFELEVS